MPTTIVESRSTRERIVQSISTNIFTGATTKSQIEQTNQLITSRSTKVWTNTPNWREVVRSGAIQPDRAFTFEEFKLKPGRVHFQSSVIGNPNKVTTVTSDSAFWYATTFGGSKIAGLDTQLRMKLLKAMRGSEFNLPVAIAESKSAIRMVTDRAMDLVEIIRDIRRGNITKIAKAAGLVNRSGPIRRFNRDFGKDASKASAGLWLEARYGWMPLMADCRNAVNTVMDAVDRPIDRVGIVKAAVRARERQDTKDTVFTGSYLCDTYRTVDDSRRGVWRWQPLPGYYPGRFGVLNPLTVAWEVVPFSFVADWFLPISDYLASFDTRFRVSHAGGTYGEKVVTNTVKAITRNSGSNPTAVGSGNAVSYHMKIVRTPMTTMPDVSLSDVQLDPNLGATQMLSAVALLRQCLSGWK